MKAIKHYKKPIAFLSFLMIFALLLNLISIILIPKDTDTRRIIRGMYEEKKNSLDIVFIGDSSLYRSIIPAKLWEEQGIASYVLGAPSMRPHTAYYLLEEMLKRQHPKAVVLEVNCAFNEHKYKMGNKRKVIDNLKQNDTKWKMIFDPAFEFSLKDKLSLIFPVFLYHNRYNELSGDDILKTFRPEPNDMKGFVFSTKRKPYKGKPNYMNTSQSASFDTYSEEYLKKIKELCDQKGISLLFLKVPGAKEWNGDKKQLIKQFAQHQNIVYKDMNEAMRQDIDWQKDTSDQGIHLNLFGAEKVTAEVGEYLHQEYSLHKTKDVDIITSFDRSLRIYLEKKEESLKKHKKEISQPNI